MKQHVLTVLKGLLNFNVQDLFVLTSCSSLYNLLL
jgi:hypothetical protein